MGQFSPSCVCCEPPDVCTELTDDLRDETIDPFVEESGDWDATVDGFETGSSDAQCIHPTVYEDIAEFETEVELVNTGDQTALYRIIWAWEDANNFWFAEVWSEVLLGPIRWWHLRVAQRASGSDTTIEDLDHMRVVTGDGGNWLGEAIRVCYQNDILQFIVVSTVSGSETIGLTIELDPGTLFSGRFGFGTGVSIFDTAVFAGWVLTLPTSGDPADCVECQANCCVGHVPKFLTLELAANDPGSCDLSGTYTLTLHNAFPSGLCTWYYESEDIYIIFEHNTSPGSATVTVRIWFPPGVPTEPTAVGTPGVDAVLFVGAFGAVCADDGWADWVTLSLDTVSGTCSGLSFTTKRFKVAA